MENTEGKSDFNALRFKYARFILHVEDGIDNLKKEHNHTFKETDLKKKVKEYIKLTNIYLETISKLTKDDNIDKREKFSKRKKFLQKKLINLKKKLEDVIQTTKTPPKLSNSKNKKRKRLCSEKKDYLEKCADKPTMSIKQSKKKEKNFKKLSKSISRAPVSSKKHDDTDLSAKTIDDKQTKKIKKSKNNIKEKLSTEKMLFFYKNQVGVEPKNVRSSFRTSSLMRNKLKNSYKFFPNKSKMPSYKRESYLRNEKNENKLKCRSPSKKRFLNSTSKDISNNKGSKFLLNSFEKPKKPSRKEKDHEKNKKLGKTKNYKHEMEKVTFNKKHKENKMFSETTSPPFETIFHTALPVNAKRLSDILTATTCRMKNVPVAPAQLFQDSRNTELRTRLRASNKASDKEDNHVALKKFKQAAKHASSNNLVDTYEKQKSRFSKGLKGLEFKTHSPSQERLLNEKRKRAFEAFDHRAEPWKPRNSGSSKPLKKSALVSSSSMEGTQSYDKSRRKQKKKESRKRIKNLLQYKNFLKPKFESILPIT